MDNHGLSKALQSSKKVLPIFIFDVNILDDLDNPKDRRVSFIYERICKIHNELKKIGSGIRVFYGNPLDVYKKLVEAYEISEVYSNRDYEPYARTRDKSIYDFLKNQGIPFRGYKDQVIFEKGDVLKDDGDPYVVYSPYMKTWRSNFREDMLYEFPTDKEGFYKFNSPELFGLKTMGFESNLKGIPEARMDEALISTYDQTRNFPSKDGTSRLGIHLRFGTISIRKLMRKAMQLNRTFANELIWREFYMMILYHFPHVVDNNFRAKYDRVEWRNNAEEFDKWCQGQTGYPIVDAGMRELVETGYMHNRVRMITASFLTKHLLIDWRWGEAFFAKHLLDYELASNNGGWQWAAGTGVDAAPYFRIFNPYTQVTKFDKDLKYIHRWLPEYESSDYPQPIVDHKMARERALKTYKMALDNI